MQIDLGTVRTVSAAVVRGRDQGQPYSYATRVQVLTLTPGGDKDKEADFIDQGTFDTSLIGEPYQQIELRFHGGPVRTRHVRINVLAYNHHPALRAGVVVVEGEVGSLTAAACLPPPPMYEVTAGVSFAKRLGSGTSGDMAASGRHGVLFALGAGDFKAGSTNSAACLNHLGWLNLGFSPCDERPRVERPRVERPRLLSARETTFVRSIYYFRRCQTFLRQLPVNVN